MEHRNLTSLKGAADVQTEIGYLAPMSRADRLERWAKLIEAQRDRTLRPLERVEYVTAAERAAMSVPSSPLTVAFEDPVFRMDGLRSDRLGDAMAYFGLSAAQAHAIVCDCHYGGTMSHQEVARRIRAVARAPMVDHVAAFRIGVACIWAATAAVLALTLV